MKKAFVASRIFLGLIFLVFGLNFFFQFINQPPMEEAAGKFVGALFESGYFFQFLKGLEVICGICLLLNVYPALIITMLTPIVIHICLFHFFLAQSGLPISLLLLALLAINIFHYKRNFKPLLVK